MRRHDDIALRAPRSRGARLARRVAAAGAALLLLGAAGCDQVEHSLEVVDPDIINPDDVRSLAGANALRVGALARFTNATTGIATTGNESIFMLSGLFTDEWRSADTFTERNEVDRRAVGDENDNLKDAYRDLHRARLTALQAVTFLEQFEAPAWQVAEMYLVQAYVENLIGEQFCSGSPFSTVEAGGEVLGEPLTTAETFERALGNVESALAHATGTEADPTRVRHAASVLKGRILLNLGRYAEAAAAVADVPTSSGWENRHSVNTATNGAWTYNNAAGRYFVGNGETENGLDFTADPRIPTCEFGEDGCDAAEAFDPATPQPLIVQLVWPLRESPVLLMTGVEARLIEAEAQLQANDAGAARATLDALRTRVNGLPALATASTDVLFQERAFWLFNTGHRLGDMRRLVRQYGRAAADVFPSGDWWKGGTYGTDVNFPIPQAEENNPNFTGCLDRDA